MRGVVLLAAASALLASCASPGPRSTVSQSTAQRVLSSTPNPSAVVAAEIAFNKAAQSEGQWTAFRRFAGTGALIHGRNGPIDALRWLSSQDDPPQANSWDPKTVWTSCTGDLAISQGRFSDPEGLVGDYLTVWKRGADLEYRWIYDIAAPDDPQPPRREAPPPPVEGEIVVSALSSVRGIVADCPEPNIPPPPPPIGLMSEEYRDGKNVSIDGTLHWTWVHAPDGTRTVYGGYLEDGTWAKAFEIDFPSPAQD